MRLIIATVAVLGLAMGAASVPAAVLDSASGASFVVSAHQQPAPTPQAEVDIDANRGGGAWWTSPTWIAIGAVVLLLLILVIAVAARGGGTTVIKD